MAKLVSLIQNHVTGLVLGILGGSLVCVLMSLSPAQASVPIVPLNAENQATNAHLKHPESCYVIYESKAVAQGRCPAGVPVVEAYDLWSGGFIGWSCDCELKNGPRRGTHSAKSPFSR